MSLSSQAKSAMTSSGLFGEQIGDDAARHRQMIFWRMRRKRHDTVVDRVAALLLVIGDDFFHRNVFFRGKALHPPYFRGLRRVRNIGACQGPAEQGGEARRASAGKSVMAVSYLLAHLYSLLSVIRF